jgi:hypothetical protein
MSSLDTRRILGSTGRLSWISCGFAWLLRFDDRISKGIAGMGDEAGSEGIKTGLDTLSPIWEIVNFVSICSIGSNDSTMFTGLTCMEFKDSDVDAVEIVGDSANVFELITHLVTSYFMYVYVQFYYNLLTLF